MKIGITGALGHIGSRFIHCIAPGEFDRVLLIDNFYTQRYCSLFNLPQKVPFDFQEMDVCSTDLAKTFEGIDAVIHLAAITNAAGSFEIQEEVERVNFDGTKRVAEACVRTGCKLICLSTTSVYGVQDEVVDEDCPVGALKPQSPYASSKLKAEQYLRDAGRANGLKFVALRFGTIYGASIGMRFHTAVNKFCWQACTNQPITVWKTALHQKRPYLELGDAVAALKFVLRSGRFDNQVYNVLTDNATVDEILCAIRTYVPSLSIEFVDSRIMNQLSYTVSARKFSTLGFQFKGQLHDGIGDTIRLIEGVRQFGPATRSEHPSISRLGEAT